MVLVCRTSDACTYQTAFEAARGMRDGCRGGFRSVEVVDISDERVGDAVLSIDLSDTILPESSTDARPYYAWERRASVGLFYSRRMLDTHSLQKVFRPGDRARLESGVVRMDNCISSPSTYRPSGKEKTYSVSVCSSDQRLIGQAEKTFSRCAIVGGDPSDRARSIASSSVCIVSASQAEVEAGVLPEAVLQAVACGVMVVTNASRSGDPEIDLYVDFCDQENLIRTANQYAASPLKRAIMTPPRKTRWNDWTAHHRGVQIAQEILGL